MKFSLIIAAAAGAIAAPHAPYTPSVSVPAHAPAAPSHSVSLPAYSVPSCTYGKGIPTATSAWGVKPTEIAEEEEEIEVEVEAIPGHEVEVEAVPGHEVEVEVEHEEEKGSPIADVCKTVFVVVEEVKELVDGDLEAIKTILADVTNIDVKELLAVLGTLKTHLSMILKLVVPKLLALVLKLTKLDITELDVKAVLDLLAEIKLILAAVEACVGELVAALEADILKLVASELQFILKVILLIAGPVIKFVLALLSLVKGLDLAALVGTVTEVVGEIEILEIDVGGLVSKILEVVPPLPL